MDMRPYYIFMIQLLDKPKDEQVDYNTPRNRHMYYVDADRIDDAVRKFVSLLLIDLKDYNPRNADQGNVKPARAGWIDGICSYSAAFVFSDGIVEYPYEVEMYDACRSGSGRIRPLMWSNNMVEVANEEFTKCQYYYTLIGKDSIIPPRTNSIVFAHDTKEAIDLVTKKINEETSSTFTPTFIAYGKHGTIAWVRSKDDVRVIILTKDRFKAEGTTESGDWYKYVESH
jgi:hypothetical protein